MSKETSQTKRKCLIIRFKLCSPGSELLSGAIRSPGLHLEGVHQAPSDPHRPHPEWKKENAKQDRRMTNESFPFLSSMLALTHVSVHIRNGRKERWNYEEDFMFPFIRVILLAFEEVCLSCLRHLMLVFLQRRASSSAPFPDVRKLHTCSWIEIKFSRDPHLLSHPSSCIT